MKKILIFALLLALLLSSLIPMQAYAATMTGSGTGKKNNHLKTFLILGDSIAAHYGVAE